MEPSRAQSTHQAALCRSTWTTPWWTRRQWISCAPPVTTPTRQKPSSASSSAHGGRPAWASWPERQLRGASMSASCMVRAPHACLPCMLRHVARAATARGIPPMISAGDRGGCHACWRSRVLHIQKRCTAHATVQRMKWLLADSASVLCGAGQEDPWVKAWWARRLKRQAPAAEYYSISPAGHCPHDECPDTINHLVELWIAAKVLPLLLVRFFCQAI